MSRSEGYHRRHVSRLTDSAQVRFDALVLAHGPKPLAMRLGIGVSSIDKLAHGGMADPELVAKVEAALSHPAPQRREGDAT